MKATGQRLPYFEVSESKCNEVNKCKKHFTNRQIPELFGYFRTTNILHSLFGCSLFIEVAFLKKYMKQNILGMFQYQGLTNPDGLYLSKIIYSSSWWLNQPTWKRFVKMVSFSNFRGEHKKYLSCHHLSHIIRPRPSSSLHSPKVGGKSLACLRSAKEAVPGGTHNWNQGGTLGLNSLAGWEHTDSTSILDSLLVMVQKSG